MNKRIIENVIARLEFELVTTILQFSTSTRSFPQTLKYLHHTYYNQSILFMWFANINVMENGQEREREREREKERERKKDRERERERNWDSVFLITRFLFVCSFCMCMGELFLPTATCTTFSTLSNETSGKCTICDLLKYLVRFSMTFSKT